MVHYINQLVTNFVYLLFGVGQVVCKQLPAAAGNNHSNKEVVGQNTKTMKMRLKSLKSLIKLKETAAMDDNSLWIHYSKLPLLY